MGTNGIVAAFSKVYKNEELAIQTQFHIAESYFELFKSHLRLERAEEAQADLQALRADWSLADRQVERAVALRKTETVSDHPAYSRLERALTLNETPDAEDEWGVNLQYYFAPWNLDAGFVYLNYNDKANHGLVGYLGAPALITPDALGLGEFKWTSTGGPPTLRSRRPQTASVESRIDSKSRRRRLPLAASWLSGSSRIDVESAGSEDWA